MKTHESKYNTSSIGDSSSEQQARNQPIFNQGIYRQDQVFLILISYNKKEKKSQKEIIW